MAKKLTVRPTLAEARITCSILSLVLNDPDWWGPNATYSGHEALAAQRMRDKLRDALMKGHIGHDHDRRQAVRDVRR